jgi:hypothetical protein
MKRSDVASQQLAHHSVTLERPCKKDVKRNFQVRPAEKICSATCRPVCGHEKARVSREIAGFSG